MRPKTLIAALVIVGAIVTGCDGAYSSVVQAMRFYRSEVVLPDAMIAVRDGKLTHVPLPGTDRPVLVRYYGPDDCNECALSHMRENEELARWAEADKSFYLLIVMAPKDEDRMGTIERVMDMRSSLTVYFDESYFFESQKVIPSSDKMHTFLLGDDRKPKYIGNPLKNESSKKRFMKSLNN